MGFKWSRSQQKGTATRKAVPPTPDSPSEHDTQALILAYLNTLPNCKAWRNNVGAVKIDSRFVRFSPVGSSDVFAIIRGRFVSIEVKAPGKVPSDAQRQWLQEVADAGGIALFTDNLDDLIRELITVGLIRGEAS